MDRKFSFLSSLDAYTMANPDIVTLLTAVRNPNVSRVTRGEGSSQNSRDRVKSSLINVHKVRFIARQQRTLSYWRLIFLSRLFSLTLQT